MIANPTLSRTIISECGFSKQKSDQRKKEKIEAKKLWMHFLRVSLCGKEVQAIYIGQIVMI
jgi:hypothetical protein